jgi:mannose-1-phosphate guanylyltransferase
MRAMLLAAGLGTRLRPWTNDRPKCMVSVGGKPVVDWTIEWLRSHGVTELVVNLHHHQELVTAHLGDGHKHDMKIAYSVEENLLGTAGAVRAARAKLGSDPFLVVYADNLIRCDIGAFLACHSASRATITLALHWRRDVSNSGVANLGPADRIRRFVEKPKVAGAEDHWVNAGLLLCQEAVYDYIPPQHASDFGQDVIPALIAAGMNVQGYRMQPPEQLLWIDTPEDLARTENELMTEGAP